jgi:cyclopropane fatty-acyl-phospholipid synthase-like methyltransferase
MNFIKKLFFQIWYFRKPPWDTNQTPPELYAFLRANPPGRALDLGCGTGTNVISLAEHGWQVTGVDFIPKAVKAARKKANRAGMDVNFFVEDVTRLDTIEGPFDLILDIGCYHSLDSESMNAYRQQVKRLLAPGGSYLLYLFFKNEDQSSACRGSNATEADLEQFSDFLTLVKRENGTERGKLRSAWLTFRNPITKRAPS